MIKWNVHYKVFSLPTLPTLPTLSYPASPTSSPTPPIPYLLYYTYPALLPALPHLPHPSYPTLPYYRTYPTLLTYLPSQLPTNLLQYLPTAIIKIIIRKSTVMSMCFKLCLMNFVNFEIIHRNSMNLLMLDMSVSAFSAAARHHQ